MYRLKPRIIQATYSTLVISSGVVNFLVPLSARTAELALEERSFNIPAQPVAIALLQFSRQANVQIVTASNKLGDAHSRAINGRLKPIEAISHLLDKTGLDFEIVSRNTVIVGRGDLNTPYKKTTELTTSGRRPAKTVLTEESVLTADNKTATSEKFTSGSGRDEEIVLQEVVVTGTRIRGVGPVGSAIVSLSQDDIEKLNLTSTSDILRTVPSVIKLGADPSQTVANQRSNANSTFLTGINIRGLGTADTLVLINGRRIAPAGSSASITDPNVIPEAAIARIDVQADGASAIYGSDAVAGVVNIQLRKPSDGAETSLRGGSGAGHNRSFAFSQFWSTTWDAGGILLAYEHSRQSSIRADAFPTLYTDNYAPYGGADLRSNSASPGNIVVGNTFYPLPPNPNGLPISAAQLTAGAPNLQSYYAGGVHALPEQTRDSGLINLHQYLFDDRVKLFAEGFYSNQDFNFFRSAQNNGVSVLNIPASNPYYIAGIPGIAPGAAQSVRYSLVNDLGLVRQFGSEYSTSGTFGVTVEAGNGWQIEPTISYSKDEGSRKFGNYVNNCALTGAISGRTIYGQSCTGTPAIADSNPITAFNPYAPGTINPATLARISANVSDKATFNRFNTGIRADGPIFDLPGGGVRLAVGAEYIRDKLTKIQQRNDGNYTPDNTTLKAFAGTNSRIIRSIYAELHVPIIGKGNALPLVKNLDLSMAGRYEEYSDFGTTTNPKFGLSWKPAKDLTIRASYGTSFRAPTLSENASNIVGTPLISVVSSVNSLYGTLGPLGGSVNVLSVLGGNPDLHPEKATTWSAGIAFKSKSTPGLDLSLTYFNVDLQKQITAITTASALTDPNLAPFVRLQPTTAEIAPLCTSEYFNLGSCAAGVSAIVDGRSQNLGGTKTTGLEFTANYAFDTRIGTLDVGFMGNEVLSFKQSLLPSQPQIERVNTVNYPLKFSGRGWFGWRHQSGLSATIFINYQNSYTNKTITPNQNVSSYSTIDLTARYDIPDTASWNFARNLSASLRINNLFDSEPPYVQYLGSTGVPWFAFDVQNASAFGRVAYLQLTKKF